MSGFADARVMGKITGLEKGDVRTAAKILAGLRDGNFCTIFVSVYGNRVGNAAVGDTVLVWGELRDGNEISVTEFGEFRVTEKASVSENTTPGKKENTSVIPATTDKSTAPVNNVPEQESVSGSEFLVAENSLPDTTEPEIPDEENRKNPEQVRTVMNPRLPVENPSGGPVLVKPVARVPSFARNVKPSVHSPVSLPTGITKTEQPVSVPSSSGISGTEKNSVIDKPNFISSRKRFRTVADNIDIRAANVQDE